MRWRGRAGSDNIEDRRGRGVRMGLPIGGIGGILLLLLFSFLTGQSPLDLIGSMPADLGSSGSSEAPADDPRVEFLSVILRDTEEVWDQILRERGSRYQPPTLVIFEQATQSACGLGQSAMGPFYCPADRQVYLDLSFFRELAQNFGAPGEFAQAYVVAHEIGHHIQEITGLNARLGRDRSNATSVRIELQADCYAGVWGHYAAQRGLLETGDAEDGLRAATAIGDDTLQRQSQGRVVPESFTHGSAEQRVQWLTQGLRTGQIESCNTF